MTLSASALEALDRMLFSRVYGGLWLPTSHDAMDRESSGFGIAVSPAGLHPAVVAEEAIAVTGHLPQAFTTLAMKG